MYTSTIEKFARKTTERKSFEDHNADKTRKGKQNKPQRGGKTRFDALLEA